ncbi:MAG: nucleotidyltransferase domain-containing protein [Dictyoglomaceae bacterium]|nr:nucleotidyltransferase domain-containing protein [Dictyoglomaceae bacterium]
MFDISIWEKEVIREKRERELKHKKLLKDVIVKLKKYFEDKKVERVYLFGSILEEGFFYDFSDIDIAVEGLQEEYFRVFSDLEDLINREIDLIELEYCKFKDEVIKKGLNIK